MIVFALVALLLQAAPQADRAPTVRVRVSPERPAVGEPITVELTVRAARGTLVRFPVLPDTGERIESLDPRSLSGGETADGVEQVATYRLIAWDTGRVDPPFGDVTLERDGRTTRYPVQLGNLRVRSVLPPDSASRQPKPPRAPLDVPTMPWRWFVAAAVVLGLAVWGWRRAQRRKAKAALIDPGAARRARESFAQLRALDLANAGETGRHALAHVWVLRRYVEERWPSLPTALTAQELDARLVDLDFPVLPERFVSLVREAEPIAYAAAPVSLADATRIADEAVLLADDLERAWLARQERARESARIKRKKLR